MPLRKLQFRPGINKEITSLSGEGGWFSCDKVRFRFGFPEKIGGWKALSNSTFLGSCRSIWNWVTLNNNNLLGLGTNLKFYIEEGTTYYDITPIRKTVNPMLGNQPPGSGNPFTTISGLTTVTVTDFNHGATTGDFVTFSGATAVGGLTLNGEYQITYVNVNTYTITASSPASSSATGGGAAVIAAYQINTGNSVFVEYTGWGAGSWGGITVGSAVTQINNAGGINNSVTTIPVDDASAFPTSGKILVDSELITYSGKTGTSFTGAVRGAQGTVAAAHADNAQVYDASSYSGWGQSVSTGTGDQLRLWSQSNYGENLLFSPRGGALYYWQTNNNAVPAQNNRGTLVSGTDVPSVINQIMVSDSTRIVIAFGCDDYGAYGANAQDPMLIRWSEQENYAGWTPAATNQAGSYRLSHGSRIVGAVQNRQEILVWTDSALYSMQYLGPPYVWGFTLLADNISIIGPNAAVTANNVTYWMGIDKFYVYSGRTETLPCSLRRYVFNDFNMLQAFQCFAGGNEGYSEVWWFYCSADSNTIDQYVIFNYAEGSWYYGTMDRTAWLDTSLRTYPVAATVGNKLVYHENGVDDGSTFPASPITSTIESAYMDIDDGDRFSFIRRLLPDITFDGSTGSSPAVTFELRTLQASGSGYNTPASVGGDASAAVTRTATVPVEAYTDQVYIRVRGREMAIKVQSTALGTKWQLGSPRIDIRSDGRRGG